MPMDFWEAQRQARSRTAFYITLFILLALVVAVLAELAMRYFMEGTYDPRIPWVCLGFLAGTSTVALYEYGMRGETASEYRE
jgi:heat shock protein HtpX